MKSSTRRPTVSLAKGQLWKTDKGYIQIWDIGKKLIDYKMMRQPGQKAARTQSTTIDTLTVYLKDNAGTLVS